MGWCGCHHSLCAQGGHVGSGATPSERQPQWQRYQMVRLPRGRCVLYGAPAPGVALAPQAPPPPPRAGPCNPGPVHPATAPLTHFMQDPLKQARCIAQRGIVGPERLLATPHAWRGMAQPGFMHRLQDGSTRLRILAAQPWMHIVCSRVSASLRLVRGSMRTSQEAQGMPFLTCGPVCMRRKHLVGHPAPSRPLTSFTGLGK